MGRRVPPPPVLALPPVARLAVPVFGAVGGCGSSVVAALLASRVHALLPPPQALAVVDTAHALGSPWPAAASTKPPYGAADLERLDPRQHLISACADIAVPTGTLRMLANGPHVPGAARIDFRGPHAYQGLIYPTQALVVDAGSDEGQSLADQALGGPISPLNQWISLGQLALAPVWVAPATGWGMDRLIAAVSAAERTGALPQNWVVVVNHLAGGSTPRPVKAQLAMLAGRVFEIFHLRHRPVFEASSSPVLEALRAPPHDEVSALALTVAAAAGVSTRTAPQVASQSTSGQKVNA